MNETEDYLDGLLNSMEGEKPPETKDTEQRSETENETEGESMSSEEDFLKSFEKENLTGENEEDFIRQFEKELDEGEDTASGTKEQDNMLFESIDGIVDSVKQQMNADAAASALDAPEENSGFTDDDADLMDLLQAEGDFSDIGDMLKADEENKALAQDNTEMSPQTDEQTADITDMPEAEEEESGKKKRRKKEKKQKKEGSEDKGVVQKISKFLFGDEEEEEKAAEPVKLTPAAPSIEDLSDENLQILQELEGSAENAEQQETPVEAEEDEKEKKKREKAAKKEQAKKEKAAKKEQAKKEKAAKKAQKVKKPKPPKEPDNTPPLPKKPVVLIFVMAASFLVLVLVGTNLFGYSHSMEEAERAYDHGDYKTAYAQVSGLEIKEADYGTYEKYRIMANAGGEYSAFQTFMEQGIYDMALDSLIRTIGRCDKYSVDAESYGCANELANIRSQAVSALAGFGLTEERAMELYTASEREDYSAELYAVLAAAGFSAD